MIADILRIAKARIAQQGWTQGASVTRGGICSVTAIRCAPIGTSEDRAAAEAALEVVVGRLVMVWNDAAGRTLGEVMTAFDEAIAEATP